MSLPSQDTRATPKTARRAAAALALVLFALYWLTASGAFHSIDEHAVFAVARNLVYHGRIDQSALYWASPYDAQAKVGTGGEMYSKYGLGHSLLVALPVALGRAIPGAGLVTTSMLLDMLATALTGGLLVLVARRLNYSVRAGVVLGALYGAASFAWVYARTMFSEPLVAFTWLLAVYLLLAERTPRRAFLAGLALAASIAIRPAMTVIVPFFLGLLWTKPAGREGWMRLLGRLIAFGAPLALTAAGLMAFNAYRFGNPLDFGYSETFNGSFFAGLLGFLFSLDRSIFLFAPPLVALIWSLPAFARRHGALAWQILAVPLASLVLYSLWPVFWGGPVWGPRYLLPALPVAFVLLLPSAEMAVVRRGWPRVALIILAATGALMQLRGVIWNSLPATQTLGQRYPLWLLPPKAEELDVAWAFHRPASLLVAAAMLGLAGFALWRLSRRSLALAAAAALAGSIVLLAWLGGSPLGFPARPAYGQAIATLQREGRPGDALVINPAPYQDPIDELVWFLNNQDAGMPFYGILRLPAGQSGPSDERAAKVARTHDRLWLLTEGVGPGDGESTTERSLMVGTASGGTDWLDEGFRLSRFEAPLPVQAQGAAHADFGGGLALESWKAAWAEDKPGTVQVGTRWVQLQPAAEDLHGFVQVLNTKGEAVAVWDSALPPATGEAPTGDVMRVLEYLVALPLPQQAEGEELRIIAGLYRASTGERLRTSGGSDSLELARFVP